MTNLSEYFFLRPSFEKFLLEPGPNKKILIGEHDRKYRDAVLNALEEDEFLRSLQSRMTGPFAPIAPRARSGRSAPRPPGGWAACDRPATSECSSAASPGARFRPRQAG